MIKRLPILCLLAVGFLPSATHAQDARDLCADRPGLGTPACTIDPGRFALELGLGDWTREKDATSRTDMVTTGDALLRFGLTSSLEAQVGWSAYGHVRERDRVTGAVAKSDGVGDVTLALRQNLRNPDGSDFAFAVMPYVTVPLGGSAIGAGDWGAGVILPASFDLGAGLSLEAVGQVDAAVDGDGKGRHLAFGGITGIGFSLTDSIGATAELSLMRDRDPDGHSTQALSGLSVTWQPNDDLQFDIGLNIGLNADSPDQELYAGIVKRF